jgi:membrane fusion protein (multidrug efflux system)
MNIAAIPAAINASGRFQLTAAAPAQPTRENIGTTGGTSVDLNGQNGVPKRKNKPPLRRIALIALLILAGLGLVHIALHWWTVGRFIESTDDAYVGGNVTVIAPEVAGFIHQLAVSDNQTVHAGDLLITLDDRDYRAALAKAEAAVAIQSATLTNLDATRRLQEAVIAQAQADITAADAEVVRTHDDQIRYRDLVANNAVSAQSSEQADTDYKRASANREKARAALTAAQRELNVIDTQKLQTQAAWQQAVAEADAARLNLGYTELRAPMDGTVGNRSAQVGAYAIAGSQLISLIPVHGLWIDANFKESQLAHLKPGAPATVTVDSLPGETFHGQVISIAPATGAEFSVLPPENATGNFTKIVQRITVRIGLDDEAAAPGQLRPGLSVIVKVDTRPAKTGL